MAELSFPRLGTPHVTIAFFARERVRKRLAGLTAGRLEVTDPWGSWSAGIGAAPATMLDVRHPNFYTTLATQGSLGICRAYFFGWWRSSTLVDLFRLFIRNAALADQFETGGAAIGQWMARWQDHRSANTPSGSRRNIHAHYDLGNDFFALFLDKTMMYSAGIFERAEASMFEASEAKLDRICRKLDLQPADHVVEIGTGWGGFAIHAASHYGCQVTTTTISQAQYEEAIHRIRQAGLSDKITVVLKDYRDLEGRFDKLVSIEMVEAVGHKFLPVYYSACADLLTDTGAMLIQAITMPDQRYDQYLKSSDFIRRYIFPGSCVPSMQALTGAAATTDLKLIHSEDIGLHYAETLRRWREKFVDNEDQVIALGYPRHFIRKWLLYLAYCEAGFEERYLGDQQLLYVKPRSPLATPLAQL
ncbi:MAG: cyclopropane-fatty-acyl-phospholipid synthase family protein [Gammaproteobacteria bacterium]|nr:cyclopropane-fatty-acyl-phospholipid synthase family protein [Gammaproteobacteria bacterium]